MKQSLYDVTAVSNRKLVTRNTYS